ncbi:Aldo-ket-red domain-containing protein [Fusarium sp. Ph1]|nr:Aldo-ket-red domain-containing protein [Fusarium sp. Ph1]
MGSIQTSSPTHTCLNPPPLVMGGAGFSYQLHPEPQSLPITKILLRAFELGVRTIDTSPYYEPSEQLMGAALSHADIQSKYKRGDYELMTKVGRIKENEFNYSPDWIRKSVARSLERFQTTYLDVVFCHDVEYVSIDEAVTAVGVLLELQRARVILRVGISGYDMDVLAEVASMVRQRYGHPVDVVQTWAQLTLHNTQVETRGFELFRAAGVYSVYCSSPLAVGLLRTGGIPTGLTGDWHPAPEGLRAAAAEAAQWVERNGNGESLSSIALQYAILKARQSCTASFTVSTITGISTLSDLEQNVAAAKRILEVAPFTCGEASESLQSYNQLDQQTLERNGPLFERVRSILGEWIDYDFSGSKAKSMKEVSLPNNTNSAKKDAVQASTMEKDSLTQPTAIQAAG